MRVLLGLFIAITLFIAPICNAQSKKPAIDLNKSLDVTELKLSMAEVSMRQNPNDQNISELISALEESLNSTCMPQLLKTLSYAGNPTDPLCITRMERLLQLNPDNPVAVCVRDGIDTPLCREAYQKQLLISYSSNGNNYIDATLKVGLASQELALLDKLQNDLRPLDSEWGNAKNDVEKQAVIDAALPVYDKMMSVACRIVVLRVTRLETAAKVEDYAIRDAREKLLKIPENLRGDYQEKMANEVEEKMARAANNRDELARLTKLLEVIREPEVARAPITASNSERKRYVLPKCFDLLKVVKERSPLFPSPICHAEGFYSPQCVSSIKSWRIHKRKLLEAQGKKLTPAAKDNGIASF